MNILLLLLVSCVFLLGRYSMKAKMTRLQKENQQLRDTLDKALHLERLGAQTYSQIVCELIAAYTQAQRDVQSRK